MKKTFISIVFFLFIFSTSKSFAKLYRIGYPGTQLAGVDYTTGNIQAAADDAAAGDTLQLYIPYWTNSASVTISKRLVILGFGYMLDQNPGLQAINSPDNNYCNIYFTTGSENSVVEGINIGNAQIETNNITIKRCRIYAGYLYNSIPLKNITISQCFFTYYLSEQGSEPITNFYLVNNYFYYLNLPNSSGLFANNIMRTNPALYSFIIKNNIFFSCFTPASNVFQNNIFASTCADITGTGNQFGVDLSSVFVNYNNGNIGADNQLVLKAGSPATGTGIKNDGTSTDLGIFGGEAGEVYKLSGIPPIPSIYKLTAPTQVAKDDPYTITISVRSNN